MTNDQASTLLRNAGRVLCAEDAHFLKYVAASWMLPGIPDPSGKPYGPYAAVKASLLLQNFKSYLDESPKG